MSNEEDIAALRRSLVTIANGLSDRTTLIRALIDELMTALIQKGVFSEEEARAVSVRALAERDKRRIEYGLPDEALPMDKMANIQRELAADVIDLAAIRAILRPVP